MRIYNKIQYKIRYHIAIQNLSWKKEIDAEHEKHDFYIKNKNKWGSFSYVIKWLLIPFLWLFIVEIIDVVIVDGMYNIYIYPINKCVAHKHLLYIYIAWISIVCILHQIIFAMVPLISFVILTYKLGEFYDVFGIKKEIFIQFLSTIILLVAYGLISATIAGTADAVALSRSVGIGVFVMIYCIFGITSVCHPIYLIKKEPKQSTDFRFTETIPDSIESEMNELLEILKDERIFS